MKNMTMLVWVTQLGLSVAVPPAGFLLLAVWLRKQWGWGDWVIWAGVLIGVVCAVQGLCASLKAMEALAKDKHEPPTVSFDDHD